MMTKDTTEITIAEQRAVSLYDRVAGLKVEGVEDYLQLGDMVKEVKAIVNTFEDETRPEIDQAHKLHKALLARKKRWSDKFDEAESLGKEKLKHFADHNEVPKIEGIIFSETWDGDVIDEKLIPDEYKVVDYAKLKSVTKALKEATNIPGWKPKSVKTISVRS